MRSGIVIKPIESTNSIQRSVPQWRYKFSMCHIFNVIRERWHRIRAFKEHNLLSACEVMDSMTCIMVSASFEPLLL